jgi:hypothetical protein
MATIKVIKYFIKSSPVGEVKDVLDDIATILGQTEFLNDPEVKQALREYYEAHLQQIVCGDKKLLVDGQGRLPTIERTQVFEQEVEGEDGQMQTVENVQVVGVEEFVYYDSLHKLKFYFHPVTMEVRIEEEGIDY